MSDLSTPLHSAAERVVSVLLSRHPPAALAMELSAVMERSSTAGSASLDEALSLLEANRKVIAQDHAAPDPHLEGLDLRAVALVADDVSPEQAVEAARRAADAVWTDWLRQFLATHRCT